MDDKLSSVFQEILVAEIGGKAILTGTQAIEGGCINNGTRLSTTVGSYFLKWNTGAKDLMFNREVTGLTEIRNQEIFRIPSDYGYGVIEGVSYLLLEDIIAGPISSKYWENFGEKLADLHCVSSDRFGFGEDNFIGKLQQVNDWDADWIEFFITNRLVKQLELAQSNNLISRELIHSFDQLFLKLPELLPDNSPSLIHGDLWSGNCIVGPDGEVCLIDPAVYYANREIEIAFTKLFGGFSDDFYSQYFEKLPVPSGFEERASIYNLYPLLVHLNLFGSSYLGSIKAILKRFVNH